MKKTICLKIDVDTYTGTAQGVPILLTLLKELGIPATFFVTLGPDNSGKAIKNILFKKGFLKKMITTKAWKLYGIKTILSGTILPAPTICNTCKEVLKRITEEGHEAGVHAWDHRKWQDHLDTMTTLEISTELNKAFESFKNIYGFQTRATAAPAWYCNKKSLKVLEELSLIYASDTRGEEPFFPVVEEKKINILQIPTTSLCIEELITQKKGNISDMYNQILIHLKQDRLNIIPIHAEVEGGLYKEEFKVFLKKCLDAGYAFKTIEGAVKKIDMNLIPEKQIVYKHIEGRSGSVVYSSYF